MASTMMMGQSSRARNDPEAQVGVEKPDPFHLYKAVMEGDTKTLESNTDDFKVQLTGHKNTILHVAAQFGQSDCVKEILKKCPSLLHKRNCKGETPLHIAAREGNLKIVIALVAKAKDIESKGREGHLGIVHLGIVHALLDRALACYLGMLQKLRPGVADRFQVLTSRMKLITRKDSLIRATNSDNDTALHIAVQNGHLEIVRFLTMEDKKFPHPANKTEETPLYLAVQREDFDMVDAILSTCTSPAYGGPYGRTALHEAALKSEKPEITTKLLELKPELIYKRDTHGWTALHYATHGGNVRAVEVLLMKEPNLGHAKAGEKDDGQTALHMAAALGNVEVMKAILSYCPDCWDMVDSKGHNVLHVAAEMEKEGVIGYMFEHHYWFRQLLYQKDNEGNTPLHLLAASKLVLENNIQHTSVAFSQGEYNTERPIVNWRDMVSDNIGKIAKWKGARTKRPEEKEKAQEDKEKEKTQEDHKDNEKGQEDHKDKEKTEHASKMAMTHMVVAALIATITFAASFAIPGSYIVDDGPDQGMAVLVRKAVFKVFGITNTIAVLCSTSAVFQYVTTSANPDEGMRIQGYVSALNLMLLAMIAMMVAFITGSYSMLSDLKGLAIATCVIGCVFLYCNIRHLGSLFQQVGISRLIN